MGRCGKGFMMRCGRKMKTVNNEGMVSKNKNKIIIRIVIFSVIALLLLCYFNSTLTISGSDSNRKIFNAFYSEKENTIDAVYLGTSASNRYFIGPMAYNETGMTVFTLATMGMPMFFVPNLIEEVEKTQDPQLYIIELRSMIKDKSMVNDAHIRRVTDSMKFSANRDDAIRKALEFTEGSIDSDVGDDFIEYYMPVIKYHDRLLQGDVAFEELFLYKDKNETKGYVTSKKTLEQVPQEEGVHTEERTELSDDAEKTLFEVLDYCDSIDKDILFVMSPFSVKEEQAGQFNTIMDIVRDRGYEVIDFNTEEMIDALDINWETDFYNSKHVNYLGAQKYTEYLTEYLKQNYDFPDHRGDPAYKSWEDSYDYYVDFIS